MRFTRLIAGLTTAGLLGLAPVAISSPAEATENLTTTTTLETVYGDHPVTVRRRGHAQRHGDRLRRPVSVYDGTVTLTSLHRQQPGVDARRDRRAGGYLSFPTSSPPTNTAYKVVYSGYAATNLRGQLRAERVRPAQIGVKRKAVFKTPGLFLVGKIKPDFKRKKVVLKRKKGKKYVAWKKVRTNKKGVFRVKAPNQRGFKFSVTIPSGQEVHRLHRLLPGLLSRRLAPPQHAPPARALGPGAPLRGRVASGPVDAAAGTPIVVRWCARPGSSPRWWSPWPGRPARATPSLPRHPALGPPPPSPRPGADAAAESGANAESDPLADGPRRPTGPLDAARLLRAAAAGGR